MGRKLLQGESGLMPPWSLGDLVKIKFEWYVEEVPGVWWIGLIQLGGFSGGIGVMEGEGPSCHVWVFLPHYHATTTAAQARNLHCWCKVVLV